MRSVELFAGAGGLALGVGLAGFDPMAVVEWDKWACDTLRENQRVGYPLVNGWPVHEGDVRAFDWSSVPEDIDLLAGGPPCQPFSMGGKHAGYDDRRDMFPATIEVVRQLRPRAFIVENVKGLTRSSFANYYQYIILRLANPEAPIRKHETWFDHLLRLQKLHTRGKRAGDLTYNVVPTLVNAADYGIPQTRHRVFMVGFRSDLGLEWSFPEPTHSLDALLCSQWITGEYWSRHGIGAQHRPAMPARMTQRIRQLASADLVPSLLPWRTTRDALIGLPDPRSRKAREFLNHRFQDGARAYPGHTGSDLDMPAKTLKAGDHGVPGGENMVVTNCGTRYFTVRESARLQTFPDGYRLHGSWTECMRQLGNAVPMMLGRIVAASVAERLVEARVREITRITGKAIVGKVA